MYKYCSLYVVGLLALVEIVPDMIHFDVSLFYLINHEMANPLLDWVLPWVTHMGSVIFWAAISIILWFKKKHRLVVTLAIGLALDGLVSWGLKNFFRRERPFLNYPARVLGDESGFSFPSAHSQRTLISSVILCSTYPKIKVPLIVLSFIVAFSRVYIGVHYPLDVTVGALNGIAIARLLIASDQMINVVLSSLYMSWDGLKTLFPVLERIEERLG